MNTRVDEAAANKNALRRALRSGLSDEAQPPPIPDRALLQERLAVHGNDSGREFRNGLLDESDKLCRYVERVRANPTKNSAQLLLEIDEAVKSNADGLLAKCGQERDAIAREEQAVDLGMELALRSPNPTLDSEYRAVLRGMTNEERAAFVKRVEKTPDAAALRYAIGSVPPELSGVSFGLHRGMRDTLLALKDPSLLTRPADLAKRKAAVIHAEDGIRRTVAELTDSDRADAIRKLTEGV